MSVDELRLRDGVQISAGNDETALLYAEGSRTPIQLGSSFWSIATLLKQGTTREEISTKLSSDYETHSREHTRDAVDGLLAKLSRNGYLHSNSQQNTTKQGLARKSLYWAGLDAVLTKLMSRLPRLPVALEMIFVSVMIGISLIVVGGFVLKELEFIQQLFTMQTLDFSLLFSALLIVYLVFMPLHELAHGVAAKSASVPVTGCGMFIKWYVFPGFFVEMRSALGVTSLYKKILIPLAGIIMDMLLLAVLVVIITTNHIPPVSEQLIGYVFCIALFVAANNLNPVMSTDGAKCLAAAFNDYAILEGAFKGKRSVHTSTSKLWLYRFIGISYSLSMVAVIFHIVVS